MITGHDRPAALNVYWSEAIFTSDLTSRPLPVGSSLPGLTTIPFYSRKSGFQLRGGPEVGKWSPHRQMWQQKQNLCNVNIKN